jgi:predicted  nucleic acid-binding Zn-ribbon protein
MTLRIAVSPGEAIDKLTILEIKLARIGDAAKLETIRREHQALREAAAPLLAEHPELGALHDELKAINERLWEVEDRLRECERRKSFGPEFVELARSVYRTNDERAAVKRKIDAHLNAPFGEQKSYSPY